MGETVSERLRKILEILSEYHASVIQSITLSSQDSRDIMITLKQRLSKDGDIIEDYLRWQIIPEDAKGNAELMKCIEKLSVYVNPWDSRISTLGPDWCFAMFKDSPLTISPEHILRMYKNSEDTTDGEQMS